MQEINRLKVTALIVLYKLKIMDSPTVQSLFNAYTSNVQLKIIIWNNGNEKLEHDDVNSFKSECTQKGITFDIYQDVRNVSLSHLYNFCISKNKDSDFITILDQDSKLDSDFLKNLLTYSKYDLICPQVFDEIIKIQNYPFISPFPEKVVVEGEFDAKKTFTIGSGLSLSQNLISKIFEATGYVFDEDFVFYFVDTELFYRFDKLDKVTGYCIGKILHSESNRLKKIEMTESVKLEMGYKDIIIRIKRKRNIIRILFLCIRHKIQTGCNFSSLFKLIKCAAITKQHPRYKFRIKPDFLPDYSNLKD